MPRERALEFKVGALVAIAGIVLVGFLVVLGSFSFSRGTRFSVDFNFAGNLLPGAPVKVSGIRVGKIEGVDFWGGKMDPAVGRRVAVRARIWVEDRARESIRQDAEFFVSTAGVLGEQYLEIAPGSWEKPPLPPGAVVRGVDPPRIDLIVARAYEFLDDVTALLREDKDVIRDFLKNGASVVRSIDGLLGESKDDLKALIHNLDRFTAETTGLVITVRKGIGDPSHLQKLLGDVEQTSSSIRKQIDPLLGKMNRALDGVANVTDVVGPKDKDKLKRTIDSLVQISDRVSQVTIDAQHMVGQIRAGKGTAGALLVDSQIYEDLKDMVRDLKRNPWKFLWRQ